MIQLTAEQLDALLRGESVDVNFPYAVTGTRIELSANALNDLRDIYETIECDLRDEKNAQKYGD